MTKVVVCETMIRPLIGKIASSKGDGTYWNTVGKTLFNDGFCDCPGYQFRGTCKHVKLTDDTRCTYHRPPIDHEKIEDLGLCPLCSAPLLLYELDPEFD